MSLAPHGGTLINRVNEQYDLTSVQKEIELDLISFADLELIGIGGYSPIEGFFTEKDYVSVVENMRLASGVVWSCRSRFRSIQKKRLSLPSATR